MAMILPDIIW